MGAIGDRSVWALAARQHFVVAGSQLRGLGWTHRAVQHAVDSFRLHPIYRDVFALGRPDVTERGRWIAAVLACGHGAALSHRSAAALLGIGRERAGAIDVSVPGERARHLGIRCHRRTPMPPITEVDAIPTSQPVFTLIDLAAVAGIEELTKATNEADRLGLVDFDELRAVVDAAKGRRGIRRLRVVLGGYTRTDSNLERRFLEIAAAAGLERPRTQAEIHGLRVDFLWPSLSLIVETDGLTYHRTPAQQAADRQRDQILTAAGYIVLRFTNDQVRRDPATVRAVLRRTALGRLPRR